MTFPEPGRRARQHSDALAFCAGVQRFDRSKLQGNFYRRGEWYI
jgi:hypothetical protein